MGFLIGRGRYAREAYPDGQAVAAAAAAAALRNRNVAATPLSLDAPFTPDTGGTGSIIAAILFTPRVSGVIQASATIIAANDVDADIYAAAVEVVAGTVLSVTGGSITSNGWVVGSTTPPVVAGTGTSIVQLLGAAVAPAAASAPLSLLTFGISQPLPVGIPVAIQLGLSELGIGHALSGLVLFGLSVLELP